MSEYFSVSNGVKQGGVLSSCYLACILTRYYKNLNNQVLAAILIVILWESCRMLITQLQFHNFCFLLDAFNSNNHIVKSCMRAALCNSNTCIGYKLAFYRYKFDLDMYNNCTSGRKLINDHNVSYDQLAIVSNLSTSIDIRAGNCYIDEFTINDIDILIEGIATG